MTLSPMAPPILINISQSPTQEETPCWIRDHCSQQNSSPKLGQRLIAAPEVTQLSTRTPDRAPVLRPLSLFWCYLHSISNLFSHRHHHFPVPNTYTDSLMDQRPSRPQEIQIGLLITDLLYSFGALLTPSQMPLQLLNAM